MEKVRLQSNNDLLNRTLVELNRTILELHQERDGLTQALNNVTQERDTLATEKADLSLNQTRLIVERDELLVGTRSLIEERNFLLLNNSLLVVQRDELFVQRNDLLREKKVWSTDKTRLQMDKGDLTVQRDDLIVAVALLKQQINALNASGTNANVSSPNAIVKNTPASSPSSSGTSTLETSPCGTSPSASGTTTKTVVNKPNATCDCEKQEPFLVEVSPSPQVLPSSTIWMMGVAIFLFIVLVIFLLYYSCYHNELHGVAEHNNLSVVAPDVQKETSNVILVQKMRRAIEKKVIHNHAVSVQDLSRQHSRAKVERIREKQFAATARLQARLRKRANKSNIELINIEKDFQQLKDEKAQRKAERAERRAAKARKKRELVVNRRLGKMKKRNQLLGKHNLTEVLWRRNPGTTQCLDRVRTKACIA